MEVKPGYKQTEVGIIPEEWEVRTLEFAAQIIDPQPDHRTPPEIVGGEPYIGISDFVNESTVDWEVSRKILPGAVDRQQTRFQIRKGDVIFGKIGTIGSPKFAPVTPFRYALSANVLLIQPKVEPYFVMSWLRSDTFQKAVNAELHSTSQAAFGINKMRRMLIALPPSPEQHAIAEALSDVDGLLAGLDRLITKKRDLKQVAMQQLLTGQTHLPSFHDEWEEKKLGEVAEVVMGQSPDSKNYNHTGDGVPLIQGNADIEDCRSIARVWTTQITKEGRVGDLLLTVRAPVGAVGYISERCCLGRGVCSLRPKGDVAFLFHALVFAKSAWKVLEQGSTFTSANSAQVVAFSISMPATTAEQTAIAEVLTDMDAELAALEQQREKTRAIRQAMMQELLTGKTRLIFNEVPHA